MFSYLLKTLVVATAIFSVVACGEEEVSGDSFNEQQDYIPVAPVPENLQGGMPAAKPKEMLSVGDPTPPEVWLLSLYQKKPGHDPSRDTAYYQQLLEQLQLHVHEDKRVIANRLVQVTRQLTEKGIEADQDRLLVDFANYLPTVEGTYVFGELMANYSNLRQQQIGHERAMQRLFELI